MPVLRGGVRRGRRGKQKQEREQPLQINDGDNIGNNRKREDDKIRQPAEENAAIATRTRRRRAAAAAVAAPVDDKIVAAAEAAAAPEVKEVEEVKRVSEEEREEVGEKPMDEYDSGGKSPDKGNAADDELASAPLPEKVRTFYCLIRGFEI